MRTGASTHYADAFDKQIKTEATLFRVKDSETDTSYDTVAYISIGQAYGLISLSSARGFSYTDYKTYHRQKNAYETALAQYNSDVASAMIGAMIGRRKVRWDVARRIVTTWILTFPACFALGWILEKALGHFL